MLTNLFHQLPEGLTKALQPKGQTQLSITAYKKGDGEWAFNKFPITFDEGLYMKEALDELAKGASKIKVHLSTTPVDGWEKAHFIEPDHWDPGASYWHWKHHDIWLCSWLPWYFGEIPETLWFSTEAV